MTPRKLMGTLVLISLTGFTSLPAAAEPALQAELKCPEAKLGRVLCEVTITPRNARLAWVDVLVVRSPEFAKPLKSRIALGKSLNDAEPSARLTLALVAKTPGVGPLDVKARAVVCVRADAQSELCRPESVQLSTRLNVAATP